MTSYTEKKRKEGYICARAYQVTKRLRPAVVHALWLLALGVGGGGVAGYAICMLVGMVRGREQVIRRVRTLVVRGQVEFDIERFLEGRGEADGLGRDAS